MFVSNHGSGKRVDGQCAPSASLYVGDPWGWFDWVCLFANYHVEHHDFPDIPLLKLPELRRIAPEFYGCSSRLTQQPPASLALMEANTNWSRTVFRSFASPEPYARSPGGVPARAWFSAYGPRCRCSGSTTTAVASGATSASTGGECDATRGSTVGRMDDVSEWIAGLRNRIDRRQQTGKFAPIHFAAHLGGEYCVDVLKGDASLVRTLWEDYGFLRVYLCPTRANGVNSSQLLEHPAKRNTSSRTIPAGLAVDPAQPGSTAPR
ncbi:Sphingolipid delta(4)-desaturase/C4-monooxygenase DES2 (Degenerative spermatocyte homolog 2) (Sphingolipid 4-desaturase) (Sphingolipid C4-monooxygenase) [Durusdinium trenchii]|uniref:Sphingolipid delta(4)-desaturase/C4-monooxygenase DES2 (Degenerative spermatocyte homolog 2) (Sphingolipid 4-desaturase) (Sphingolipid C4-monooxygenase) n=1 Tax=Durusdinium trenchii TaxID=1381693 RepID=A0ABP0N5U1_9DINO